MNIKIFLGKKCNQQCSYCDVRNKQVKDFTHLDELLYFISQIDNPILSIEGGEPFMYNEIVNQLIALNIPIHILTNGTLLTKEIIESLHSEVILKISLDGPIYINDAQRSNYEIISKNLSILQQYNIPFDIGTTFTEQHIGKMKFVKNEMLYWKPRIWTITPQMFTNEGEEGMKKTRQLYEILKSETQNWDLPFPLTIPNFFEAEVIKQENPEDEIYFQEEQIEIHRQGYHTEQKKIYHYNELKDLIDDTRI